MSQQLSKNHHYVPQFYLKKFAGDGGKVWDTWVSEDGCLQEKARSPKSIASEEHLYGSIRTPLKGFDEREDSVEAQFLSPIDNAASIALEKILATPADLQREERRDWARFVRSLLERHPEIMARRQAELESVRSSVLSDMFAKATDPEGEARLKDALDGIDFEEMKKQLGLNLLVREVSGQDDLDHLADFSLRTIPGDWGFPLHTSDSPVLINFGQGGFPDIYTVSLTPSVLLFARRPDVDPLDEEAAKLVLLKHSATTIERARHIYSRGPLADDPPLKFRTMAAKALRRLPWPKQ